MELRKRRSPVDVVIVLPNLASGGAQRQGLFLAGELAAKDLNVEVFLTHSDEITESNARLSSSIPVKSATHLKFWAPLGLIRVENWILRLALQGSDATVGRRKAVISTLALRGLSLDITLFRHLRPYAKMNLAVRPLRFFLRHAKPLLVIGFLPQSNITLLLAKNPGAECVVVERNDFDRQYLGGVRNIREQLYPHADALMANSLSACRQLRATFPEKKVRFLPNSYIDTGYLDQTKAFSKIIFVVGRLVPQKNPIESLQSFLQSGLGNLGWSIWFVGGGELYEALCAEAIESAVLGKSVKILGEVPQEEIPYDYAGFVLLNSDYEGAPNVLAEALERGIVPIFRDTVLQASEIVPPDLVDRMSFSSAQELEQIFRQLPSLESDFTEISGRLRGYYGEALRNHKMIRDETLNEMIAAAGFGRRDKHPNAPRGSQPS